MDEEEAIVMEINEKAGQIVETAIHNAVEYLENLQMRQQMALEEPRTCPEKEQSYAIKNINWTSCEEFTVNNGIQQIEDYISTWEFHESWLHCTDFLHEEELEFCKRYHYRMNWSLPTCRKPIPRAIASIYFIIEISKVKPCTWNDKIQRKMAQRHYRNQNQLDGKHILLSPFSLLPQELGKHETRIGDSGMLS
ncbi:A-kinase anchor protein 14 isoform X1 [Ambystoma mexicanum]|uniref:A-kinase anchor protein 14 isoform X1 n=1 Tax=Ambystoma mexicanum TaxID=8296 RepID=UPI0037E86D44